MKRVCEVNNHGFMRAIRKTYLFFSKIGKL